MFASCTWISNNTSQAILSARMDVLPRIEEDMPSNKCPNVNLFSSEKWTVEMKVEELAYRANAGSSQGGEKCIEMP